MKKQELQKEELKKEDWDIVIRSHRSLFHLNLRELVEYRDLIKMFVSRNLKVTYKQTVLGPLWLVLTPLLSSSMFTVVFGMIAKLPTDEVPQFIFYMIGNIIWNFFSGCLLANSGTFVNNSRLFGKVYFPRLTVPIATILSKAVSFFVQFALFLCVVFIYKMAGAEIHIRMATLVTPILLVMLGMLSLGGGIIISSLTTKYRDFSVVFSLLVQLWMYATPIVYSVSVIPKSLYPLIMLNPVAPIVECFRFAWLGCGSFPVGYLVISFVEIVVILIGGILLFNRVERTFMDTV